MLSCNLTIFSYFFSLFLITCRLWVLTYSRDGCNNFSQFKFVQDCCFTSCIKTHCKTEEQQCELWTRLEPEEKEDGVCCWRLEQDRRQEVDEDEYHTKSWAVLEWEKQPVSQDTVVEIWLLKSDPWMNYLEIDILKNIFAWTVHVHFITLYWKFYSWQFWRWLHFIANCVCHREREEIFLSGISASFR